MIWPTADELVERAIAAVGQPIAAAAHDEQSTRFAEVEAAALRLHAGYHAVIPPTLGPVHGVKARLGRFVKRFVRKMTSWYIEPRWAAQREFNADVARFSTASILSMYQLHSDLVNAERRNAQLVSAQARQARQLSLLAARTEQYNLEWADQVRELRAELARFDPLSLRVEVMALEVSSLSEQIPTLFERMGVSSAGRLGFNYVEFENRFRGDSDATSRTQRDYVAQFPSPLESGMIVDIGCGRGEMVQLLHDAGHESLGIDSDLDMIEACRSSGIPVELGNGLTWLEEQPPNSLKGVFCAQVVEHFVTPELERFVAASFRALRPGGIMIVETINPRSFVALANHFFADLSHVRPIHPETLRFMCEQVGFSESLLEERSPHELMKELAVAPVEAAGSDSALDALVRTVFGYQDYSLKVIK